MKEPIFKFYEHQSGLPMTDAYWFEIVIDLLTYNEVPEPYFLSMRSEPCDLYHCRQQLEDVRSTLHS
jgi:hypothetical protein